MPYCRICGVVEGDPIGHTDGCRRYHMGRPYNMDREPKADVFDLKAKLQLATLALERYEKEAGHCHHDNENENTCFCFQQTAQRVLYQIRDESPAGTVKGKND